MNNFKNINIGALIKQRVSDYNMKTSRICNFFNINEKEIKEIYESKSLDVTIILKWSKLLEYDFFRIYSQHLILYAPPASDNMHKQRSENKAASIPEFRKNIYTIDLIYFILELIETGQKTKQQVIDEYRIPKTTLHSWINKYRR
ncbi:transposase [Chryseobacterium sp. H1D6B]|uniref:transposase n=1 Tax=Chryseobacterium sp. H1D6B TaxID=2940588 RepID=UPI0015C94954|nr:transposase [Chryseobacterium sp. H1D6B]